MAEIMWGLLGPEKIESTRRRRTLNLGATLRSFNDLAVPGLGNIWYGKQLLLPALGITLAQHQAAKGKSISNIATANAIEALACWLAFDKNKWQSDARLLGSTKMRDKTNLTFHIMSKPGFYVTQPMRMQSLQALAALGLVDAPSGRFNAYTCSVTGGAFIAAFSHDDDIVGTLDSWITGGGPFSSTKKANQCAAIISPREKMSESAATLLRHQLEQGSSKEAPQHTLRRRQALTWVESLRNNPAQEIHWKNRPAEITDPAHWKDLHSGALFFNARDKAVSVLDAVENHLGPGYKVQLDTNQAIPESIRLPMQELRVRARAYLELNHADEGARQFCRECVEKDDAILLRSLVKRDDRILRLNSRNIIEPGSAYRGKAHAAPVPLENAESAASDAISHIAWPEGLSHRVPNLFLLNADMKGELHKWTNLGQPGEQVQA